MGDSVPDFKGDGIARGGGGGERLRAEVGGYREAVLAVDGLGHFDDLAIADVTLEGSGIAVGAGDSVQIDAHLSDLAGGAGGSTEEASVEDQAAADAGAESHAHGVFATAGGAVFPFGVGHAVGVVFNDGGQAGFFRDDVAQGHGRPTFHVGEVVGHASVEVHRAGDADADRGDVGMRDPHRGDGLDDGVDEEIGMVEILGGDALDLGEEIFSGDHGHFDRGASEIDADDRGCRH